MGGGVGMCFGEWKGVGGDGRESVRMVVGGGRGRGRGREGAVEGGGPRGGGAVRWLLRSFQSLVSPSGWS
jgi:hypothetical protein